MSKETKSSRSNSFSATLEIIGINPFVFVPDTILASIFEEAGRSKGFIPIAGTINGKPFTQTLVRYSGEWRLYINTTMLKDSSKRIGETIDVVVAFDPSDRTIAIHPKLQRALEENESARMVFEQLPPSRRKEIVRYIANLKSEEARDKNILKAIDFLNGNGRFVGRDSPV